MTIRLSEGLRNRIAQGFGFGRSLHNGWIDIRSGAQPATANAAVTGTQLGIVTVGSAAYTPQTVATGILTVTGGSGTLSNVLIGTLPIVADPGRVVWVTSNTATAALIANAINTTGICRATSSGDVITIYAPPGIGTLWNGIATTSTGITCTAGVMGTPITGVAAINGLYLAQPAAGVIAKPTGVTWSCAGLYEGTAGWFRFCSADSLSPGRYSPP